MSISDHSQPHKGKFDSREFTFLEAFYGSDPATKGNVTTSITKAGWAPLVGAQKAKRILRHFGDASAGASLNAVGVNKPYLALRIRHVLENGSDKEILAAARLAYALLGESTDERGGGVNINNPNAPIMVVVGASRERIAALRAAAPQPSREELDRLQNERVEGKLARLRSGESFVKHPHSEGHEGAYEGRWERQQQERALLAPAVEPGVPGIKGSQAEKETPPREPIPIQPSSLEQGD